jgi:hypothetical protein
MGKGRGRTVEMVRRWSVSMARVGNASAMAVGVARGRLCRVASGVRRRRNRGLGDVHEAGVLRLGFPLDEFHLCWIDWFHRFVVDGFS